MASETLNCGKKQLDVAPYAAQQCATGLPVLDQAQ